VADRVRAVPARKRASGKRPAKKKRTRRPGILVLAALAALILGFLAKRVMIPSAVHYIAYRAPDQPQASSSDASEQLTPADRRELDEIIKRKTR
jgi:hypothetical protein